LIVATQSYETTDSTIDPQVEALRASGANVLLTAAIPRLAAQAIRKLNNVGWRPTHFLANVSVSVGSVMSIAGSKNVAGIISAGYLKEPTDPAWHDTPEYLNWLAWMKKYNPSADVTDVSNVYGYSVAQTIVAVLKVSGDDLSRENVMKRAASIRDLKLPMLLPGITISTSANDFAPIKQFRLIKFDGAHWRPLGNTVSASKD
jgi:branched-chain amino acid transport system substrate-binding protein